MREGPDWHWYASTDEEVYTVGPELSRDAIIQAATGDELGLDIDMETGEWTQHFHIVEARQSEIRLAPSFDAAAFVDMVNDEISDYGNEDGDAQVELTPAQAADFERAIRAAMDQWQGATGLRFHTWMFTSTRNGEAISLSGVDEAVKARAALKGANHE